MTFFSLEPPTPQAVGARKEYHLVFPDRCGDAAKRIDFHSDDGHEAFILAERESPGRSGQIWLEDRLLCDLVHNDDGVWSIRLFQQLS